MKLWRIVSVALMILCATQQEVAAQDRNFRPMYDFGERHEFALSFGLWPMRPNMSFDRDDDYTDRRSPFEVTGEYLYHASKRFSVGLNLTYIPVFNDNDDWDYDRRQEIRHNAFGRGDGYEETIIVVMPSIRMEWVKTRSFSLYSRLAAGVGLEFDQKADQTHAGFTFQAVPFGVTIGRTVYARIEFPSFGYQGLFNAGLGYRF